MYHIDKPITYVSPLHAVHIFRVARQSVEYQGESLLVQEPAPLQARWAQEVLVGRTGAEYNNYNARKCVSNACSIPPLCLRPLSNRKFTAD